MTGPQFPRRPDLQKLLNAGPRFWLQAIAWSGGLGLAIATPTVLIANRFFTRMTPPRWWDYAFWVVGALLGGTVMASRRLPRSSECNVETKTLLGGGLTYIAVGCPVCNKIVVALLGVSGALNYFAPIQPILGILAMALLLVALGQSLDGVDIEKYTPPGLPAPPSEPGKYPSETGPWLAIDSQGGGLK